MGWTLDQEKAINTSGTNIIVSAGAGSGKTAVLSERVLHFVKDENYKLEEFLILTFTRLAAEEMKDRIRKKLQNNNLEEAKNVDTSDITTFDSFAFGICKKYHFLLGLSPNVSIVDSNIIAVRKRTYIDEIFDEYYLSNNPVFISLLTKHTFDKDEDIKDLVLKLQQTGDLELDKEGFFNNFVDKYYNDDFINDVIDEMTSYIFKNRKKFIDSLYELTFEPLTKKDPTPYQTAAINACRDFINASNYDELVSSYNNIKLPSKPRNIDESEGITVKIMKGYKEKLDKFMEKLPSSRNEIISSIKENKEYAELLINMVKELDKRQYAYKVERQIFEFQDIAKMALNLVKTHPEIALELKSHYKMIMIDEYQDTSALQENFISYIQNDNVYMVGDIKQSIYAFRNAKSDIFQGKYSAYKENNGGVAIDMNKNFRSRGEVLDDINLIFGNIMTEDIGGADYKKYHHIEFGNTTYEVGKSKNQNYHSDFIYYNGEKTTSDERADLEARIIAHDIISKINNKYQIFVPSIDDIPATTRDAEFKDFCILMDRGTRFEVFKKVFTEYQIPLFEEKDEDVKDNLIIQVLTNLINVIVGIKKRNYTSQDFIMGYCSLARSFIYEHTDEEIYDIVYKNEYDNSVIINQMKDIMYRYNDLSNYELLVKIVEELDIYHKFVLIGDVKKNEGYLDTFLDSFKQMEALDYSFEDFITYLKHINEYNLRLTISSNGSSTNAVRIINIHKSKGLEFNIIYFPGLDVGFNREANKDNYRVSSDYGLILPSTNEESNYIIKTLTNLKSDEQDLSEKIRLFYVALTRAKEKMIFVLPSSDKEVDIEDAMMFHNFIYPFMMKLNHHQKEDDLSISLLNKKVNNITHKQFDLREINFDKTITSKTHASKNLKVGVDNSLLNLGTILHEVMEIMDFVNPDYSIIKSDKIKGYVTKFLSSDLMKNIKEGSIYKEYEYSEEEVNGIIDLFVVYNDHIDIIDYKTKNISDSHYDEQLNTYKNYLSKLYDLPIHMYLYSLIDGIYREVK